MRQYRIITPIKPFHAVSRQLNQPRSRPKVSQPAAGQPQHRFCTFKQVADTFRDALARRAAAATASGGGARGRSARAAAACGAPLRRQAAPPQAGAARGAHCGAYRGARPSRSRPVSGGPGGGRARVGGAGTPPLRRARACVCDALAPRRLRSCGALPRQADARQPRLVRHTPYYASAQPARFVYTCCACSCMRSAHGAAHASQVTRQVGHP